MSSDLNMDNVDRSLRYLEIIKEKERRRNKNNPDTSKGNLASEGPKTLTRQGTVRGCKESPSSNLSVRERKEAK